MAHHIPTATLFPDIARASLMAYGDVAVAFRQTGTMVGDFAGRAARDLPVERPTKFEMVINLKTAKAGQLDIGLMRATK